MVVFRRQRS